MNAIALRDATEETGLATRHETNLGQWAEEARQAANVAVSLAKTPFVPASLRDRDAGVTAANITAAILTGQELGLEPMAALRSIDVIQGTPALRAIALRAVVLSAGHEMWVAESTQTRAVVRGRRRGTDQVQESIWTADRAKALGLIGKDNWKRQPGAMLIARATSECARLIAADALLGVPYTVEELDDGADAQVVPADTGPKSTTRRTAQRRTARQAPAAARQPDEEPRTPDPEPSFDEPGDGGEDPITEAQMKWLQAHYKDVERVDRLAEASGILGRDIDSFSSLNKADASRLIDDIERHGQELDKAAEDLFEDGAS
ncbi:MAG TPA: hypothetical protein VGK79_00760 [Gaiellaceae bacterium]